MWFSWSLLIGMKSCFQTTSMWGNNNTQIINDTTLLMSTRLHLLMCPCLVSEILSCSRVLRSAFCLLVYFVKSLGRWRNGDVIPVMISWYELEIHRWMGIFNWSTFRVTPIQDSHNSKLIVSHKIGYTSVSFKDPKIRCASSWDWAQTHSEH